MGLFLWSKRYGDIYPQWLTGAAFGAGGTMHVVGYFRQTLDMGSGTMTSAGFEDVYTANIVP